MSSNGVSPTGIVSYATRDTIFGSQDLVIEELFIPEWNSTVRIRSLTAMERDEFEHSMLDQRGRRTKIDAHNIRAKLAVLCLVDGNGARLFKNEEYLQLGLKNASALSRIYNKSQELSGVTDEDIEELAGEMKSDPKGVSNSNSPLFSESP